MCWNLAWRDLRHFESTESGSEVDLLIDGDCGECLPTIDFPHVDLPRGEQRPEQHRSSIGRRQHGFKANALSRGGETPTIQPSRQRRGAGLGGEQEPGPRLLAEREPQIGWSARSPVPHCFEFS
jgi:hypothetical protein